MAERVEQTSQLIARSLHFSLTLVEKSAGEYFCAIEAKKWSLFFSSETVVISALNRRVMTSALIRAYEHERAALKESLE